jgi:hypothetical protein
MREIRQNRKIAARRMGGGVEGEGKRSKGGRMRGLPEDIMNPA